MSDPSLTGNIENDFVTPDLTYLPLMDPMSRLLDTFTTLKILDNFLSKGVLYSRSSPLTPLFGSTLFPLTLFPVYLLEEQ